MCDLCTLKQVQVTPCQVRTTTCQRMCAIDTYLRTDCFQQQITLNMCVPTGRRRSNESSVMDRRLVMLSSWDFSSTFDSMPGSWLFGCPYLLLSAADVDSAWPCDALLPSVADRLMASKACINRLQKEYKALLKVTHAWLSHAITCRVVSSSAAMTTLTCSMRSCRSHCPTLRPTPRPQICWTGTTRLRESKAHRLRAGSTTGASWVPVDSLLELKRTPAAAPEAMTALPAGRSCSHHSTPTGRPASRCSHLVVASLLARSSACQCRTSTQVPDTAWHAEAQIVPGCIQSCMQVDGGELTHACHDGKRTHAVFVVM